MLFAVTFIDNPNTGKLRTENLSAHIDWLDIHRDSVLVGGSLRHNPSEPAIGGLWIVDLPDKASVESLIKTDPFWEIGLRTSYEILHWSKAFEDRKTPV